MFIRNLVFVLLLILTFVLLVACPKSGEDTGDLSQTSSTSSGRPAPIPGGVASSTGDMGNKPNDPATTTGTAEGTDIKPASSGETTPPPATPTDASGNPLKTIKGEIVSIDVKAKTVELIPEGSDKTRVIKIPLSDKYPKCQRCGDDRPVKAGEKGEFYIDVTPEGKMTFIGIVCDCENPGEGTCADCQNKEKENQDPAGKTGS